MSPKLEITIGSLKLKNPVMVASGTFGWLEEFADFMDLRKLGAIVTKTITLKPRKGNPPPRTCETAAGMLNSIGLENPGIDKFIQEKLPILKRFGVPIIVSISSEKDPQEFIELTKRLDKIKEVAAIELNISCPNIRERKNTCLPAGRENSPPRQSEAGRGEQKLIAQNAKATYDLVKSARKATKKILIAKLSPNVTDITEIAQAAEGAGSDAIAMINTFSAMCIDVEKRKPKIVAITGGLSGPAIRPIAIRMVWEVYQKVKIPIIGMGGIMDTQSALEFFLAGATAISVSTGNFINPKASVEIIEGIKKYLAQNKIKDFNNIVGAVKT